VNKKGIESSMWVVGMVVIFVIMAVIVIMFYDIETGRFSAFIRHVTGGDNVEDVTAHCNSLVARSAQYEYCCAKKDVKHEVEDKVKQEELTCQELSSMKSGSKVEKMNCGDIC